MKIKELEYIRIFDYYPDAVILFDSKQIIDANKMCVEMLGWEKEELKKFKIKSALNNIISTQEKEEYIELKINNIINGDKESFNALSQRKDGSIFHAKFIFNPLKIEKENYTQVIIKDISERVIFEEAIRSSEERFKIFSSVVHNSALFLLKNMIIDCNDQFVKLFEFHSKNEVIGKNITNFIDPQLVNKIRKTLNIEKTTIIEIKTFTRRQNPIIIEATINTINYLGQELEVLLLNDVTRRKKTEIALEQTTNRYKSLVENSPNGIFIVTDKKIKFANSRGFNMLGYIEEDDVYDMKFENIFTEESKKLINEDLQNIRSGGDLNPREAKIINKQGDEIEVNVRISLTVYNNQPSFQINLHNLTTRRMLVKEQMRSELLEEINKILKREIGNHKKTQAKLQDIQEFMTNIFESSIDMIIAVDQDRNIIEFNTAAQRSFGYTKKEALSRKLVDFMGTESAILEVENKLTKKGRFRGEVEFISKDKNKIMTFLSASWIKDKDGNIIGSMGVLRDITELKKSEKEAIQEKAKLDAIFNSTENMMIWIMSKEGIIQSSNENLINYFKNQFSIQLKDGSNFIKDVEKAINKDLYQKQLDEFKKAFNGKTHQFTLPLIDKNGNESWLQIFLNPISVDGKIDEISCLMFDISERIIIDRKVRDSLKEKEVLLKEVHHRVKNNLQVISSILYLQSGYVDDEKTLQILEESQSRIKAMSYIHETLYQTSDFSAIDFTDYIRTLVSNLIQSYNTKISDLSVVMDLDQIELALDYSIPCGLIVNELVTNAMKYAFEGIESPVLKIGLKENGDQVEILVSDNGIGLPKDFKYQESDSLGIQLVYTLVEQLRGNINVSSKNGTDFLITFDKTLS